MFIIEALVCNPADGVILKAGLLDSTALFRLKVI
jgi:hypothetical protein